jgi:predicted ATP-dependent endonuclease of OLD family
VVEKTQHQGTTINNKPHSNKWKAIRSAVGLLAADSFLLGDSCLVVEGVSDHIYIAGLSPFLAELGEPHLDLNETAIIPAASASETEGPVRFCQAEKIPVVVLLDSDNQGDQAAEALLTDGFIRPEQVVRIDHSKDRASADTRAFEDLLPLDLFLAAVNAACAPVIKQFAPLTTTEVATARNEAQVAIPIVNAIKKIFTERKYGNLDKRLVAETFVNDLPGVENLSESELTGLRKDFAECARLLEIIRGRLRKIASEVEK